MAADAVEFVIGVDFVCLIATIREAGDFTYNTVRNGARSQDAREQGGRVDVEKRVVVWSV